MSDLIDRKALIAEYDRVHIGPPGGARKLMEEAPAVDSIPVERIKNYLQVCLDKWHELGDRRFEPANMWGYNFIMACFDDLAAYESRQKPVSNFDKIKKMTVEEFADWLSGYMNCKACPVVGCYNGSYYACVEKLTEHLNSEEPEVCVSCAIDF